MNHARPAVCFMLHSEHQDIKVKTVWLVLFQVGLYKGVNYHFYLQAILDKILLHKQTKQLKFLKIILATQAGRKNIYTCFIPFLM